MVSSSALPFMFTGYLHIKLFYSARLVLVVGPHQRFCRAHPLHFASHVTCKCVSHCFRFFWDLLGLLFRLSEWSQINRRRMQTGNSLLGWPGQPGVCKLNSLSIHQRVHWPTADHSRSRRPGGNQVVIPCCTLSSAQSGIISSLFFRLSG